MLKMNYRLARAGVIQVTLGADDDVTLSVTDNGIGRLKDVPEGVGSRVVALLTQQLGRTMTLEGLDPGCRVTLRMPKPAI